MASPDGKTEGRATRSGWRGWQRSRPHNRTRYSGLCVAILLNGKRVRQRLTNRCSRHAASGAPGNGEVGCFRRASCNLRSQLRHSRYGWGILVLAIANGALREAILIPDTRQTPGYSVLSGVLLSGVPYLHLRTLRCPFGLVGRRLQALRRHFGFGWLCLTLAFEFMLGRLIQGEALAWLDFSFEAYTFQDGGTFVDCSAYHGCCAIPRGQVQRLGVRSVAPYYYSSRTRFFRGSAQFRR